MRAIQVNNYGEPEVLAYVELPTPEPGEGQALVRVAAIGVNFTDVHHRTGRYLVPLPFTPGMEASGEVETVGEGVSQVKPGDRVAWAPIRGSYAEYAVVPADRLLPIPDGLDDKLAAATLLQGMTAHMLVTDVFAVQPGQIVLVHAAAGGVGLLLTQVTKKLGARLFATVSTAEKAQMARQAGADEVILYSKEDFEEAIKRLTGGEGAHVVYDSVGATTFEKSLKCLRSRGMLTLYGSASGPAPLLDPNALGGMGSLFVTRPTLVHYIAERDDLLRRAEEVFDWVVSGELNVHIGGTYALKEAPQAHRDLEGRKTTGKLLLIP